MKKSVIGVVVSCAFGCAVLAGATQPPELVTAQVALDPDIVSMVGQVDPNRIASHIQALSNFRTRHTCSDNTGVTSEIGAARDWIKGQLAVLPGVQTVLHPWTATACGDTRTLHNVVAWIPGNGHPQRLIVIGGHYDSKNGKDSTAAAPGANDSGSQTALVMEAARVMSGHAFDATVVFAAWSGEEQNALGSAAFVRNYRNYFPAGTIEMNFNADIVGGDNTVNSTTALQQFRLFSPGTPRETSATATGSTDDTSPSRGLMRSIGYWGGAYVPAMTMLAQLREDRPGRYSDHRSFINRSVPAVRFIDVNENPKHQHSINDIAAYVTPPFTARVAQVFVASVANLARGPTPPQKVTASRATASATKVTWSPPVSGALVDHYVISARLYTDNFYRTRFSVPAGSTAVTVRLDNDLGISIGTPYYISVAAVDATGHESVYAYPEYRCDANNVCSQPADALNVTAKQ